MQDSKHIVIDARSRPSSTGRYIDRLLEHLQEIDEKNRYTVLLDPKDSWKPKSRKFKTLICPYKKFSFNLIDQYSFAEFLKKLGPDLVHFGMTPQEPLFYNGKRVTTLHDLTMLRFARAGHLPKWLHFLRMVGYRVLLKQSLKKAAQIIVPSEFVKHDVIKYLPTNSRKVTVTLEASEPPLDMDAKPLENAPEYFILYVGSAFPHKNLERLIEGFEIVHEKLPDLKLILVGKKEQYYRLIEKLALKYSAKDNIIFTGFVSEAQLKWLYTNAKAYVFPSLSEGFSLSGLEAMVYDCPVVSSNATCLPEIYKDAVVYFDPLNISDMAEKIILVLTHKTLANELELKGSLLIKQYSWRKMAKETLSIYESVLADS